MCINCKPKRSYETELPLGVYKWRKKRKRGTASMSYSTGKRLWWWNYSLWLWGPQHGKKSFFVCDFQLITVISEGAVILATKRIKLKDKYVISHPPFYKERIYFLETAVSTFKDHVVREVHLKITILLQMSKIFFL